MNYLIWFTDQAKWFIQLSDSVIHSSSPISSQERIWFQLFLTQSYYKTSEVLEYSAWVIWTTFKVHFLFIFGA